MEAWLEDNCTGCEACINACQVNAISMLENPVNGFLYPFINKELCTECKICEKICPIQKKISFKQTTALIKKSYSPQEFFAAQSKNDELRFQSTSGGIFTELAKAIISVGGLVYGAGYDEDMNVVHLGINELYNISKIRGSKYVQSRIGYLYREIKTNLNMNVAVLFVGSPCQVAGLYSYLEHDYDNLYTIEFICIGVNSPYVYRKWLNEIVADNKSKVSNIWFKYKKNGWRNSPFCTRIDFENCSSLVLDFKDNFYMKGFLQGNYFIRPCCSNCHFVGEKRIADIIFGDFWSEEISDDKGTSVVIINSNKGSFLFNSIKENIDFFEVELHTICNYNPRYLTPINKNPLSLSFYEELKNKSFSEIMKKYLERDNSLSDIMIKILPKTD